MRRKELFVELTKLVAEAWRVGVTEDEFEDIVVELEVNSGTRPIELEHLWDPRRMSKGFRRS